MKKGVGAADLLFAAGAFGGFLFLAAGGGVRIVELGYGAEETFAVFDGEVDEKAAVVFEAFEKFGRLARKVGQSWFTRGRGGHRLVAKTLLSREIGLGLFFDDVEQVAHREVDVNEMQSPWNAWSFSVFLVQRKLLQ
jgi:hypothetical protein